MNRDEFPTCPRCGAALDGRGSRWVCAACQGLLIEDAEVSRLIADMLGTTVSMLGWSGKVAEPQPLKLEGRPADEPTVLICPRCEAAMAPQMLYGIKVDRCQAHGIWFDRKELESALRKAASVERPRSSLGEKLFGGALVTAYIAGVILQLLFA